MSEIVQLIESNNFQQSCNSKVALDDVHIKSRKERDALHLDHKRNKLLCDDLQESIPLKTFIKYKKDEVKAYCFDGFRNTIYTVTAQGEFGQVERLNFDSVRGSQAYSEYQHQSSTHKQSKSSDRPQSQATVQVDLIQQAEQEPNILDEVVFDPNANPRFYVDKMGQKQRVPLKVPHDLGDRKVLKMKFCDTRKVIVIVFDRDYAPLQSSLSGEEELTVRSLRDENDLDIFLPLRIFSGHTMEELYRDEIKLEKVEENLTVNNIFLRSDQKSNDKKLLMTIDLGFTFMFITFLDKNHEWEMIGSPRITKSTEVWETHPISGKKRSSDKRFTALSVIEDDVFILMRFKEDGLPYTQFFDTQKILALKEHDELFEDKVSFFVKDFCNSAKLEKDKHEHLIVYTSQKKLILEPEKDPEETESGPNTLKQVEDFTRSIQEKRGGFSVSLGQHTIFITPKRIVKFKDFVDDDNVHPIVELHTSKEMNFEDQDLNLDPLSVKLSPDKRLMYIQKKKENEKEKEGSILVDTNSLEILMDCGQKFQTLQNDMLFSAMNSRETLTQDYFEAVDLLEGTKSTSLKHQHYEPRIVSDNYIAGRFAIIHNGKVHKFGTMRITNPEKFKSMRDTITSDRTSLDFDTRMENKARFSIHNEMNGEKVHEFTLDPDDKLEFDVAGDDQNILSNSVHLYWHVKKRKKIYRVRLFGNEDERQQECAHTTIAKVSKIVTKVNHGQLETYLWNSNDPKNIQKVIFQKEDAEDQNITSRTNILENDLLVKKEFKVHPISEQFEESSISLEDRRELDLFETNQDYFDQNQEYFDQDPDLPYIRGRLRLPGGDITKLYLVSKESNQNNIRIVFERSRKLFLFTKNNGKIREVRIDYEIQKNTESQDKDSKKNEMHFSWLRQEFFLVERDGIFDIFCTRDGSRVAHIPKKTKITIETMKLEFQRQVLAFVDKRSKRIYPPTLEAVLHLGQVQMLTQTFENCEKNYSKKVHIFGQIAPSCYFNNFQKLQDCDENEKQGRIARFLKDYTLRGCKKIKKQKIFFYENVLHFLCEQNNGEYLVDFLKQLGNSTCYIASPFSPIVKSKMMTFFPLLDHLNGLPLNLRMQIFRSIGQSDFLNVLSFPGGHIQKFFDDLKIELSKEQEYNPFQDIKLAVIKPQPNHFIDHIEKLHFMHQGMLKEEEKELLGQLIEDESEDEVERNTCFEPEEKVSVSFYALLAAFDWTVGSYESLMFLKELNKKKSELNQLFGSKVIQKILTHKFNNVKYFGYFLAFLYVAYLMCVTFIPTTEILIFWSVFYLILNIRLLQGLHTGKFCGFIWGLFDFWKTLDLMRIGCLIFFIYIKDNECYDNELKINSLSFLTTISWILLLEQFRLIPSFTFVLTLLRASIVDMATFTFVLLIINQGFQFGYLRTINTCWAWETGTRCENQNTDDLTSVDHSMRNMWTMMFADFGDIQLETRMQMTIFILWGVAIPILSMNLLIAFLGDTYTRVYEQKEKANYSEMVKLILDLEMIKSWFMCNTENEKSHLIYCDILDTTFTAEVEEDMTIGIGQKVNEVGKRIKKQIQDQLPSKEEFNSSMSDMNAKLEFLMQEIKEVKQSNQDLKKAQEDHQGLVTKNLGDGSLTSPQNASRVTFQMPRAQSRQSNVGDEMSTTLKGEFKRKLSKLQSQKTRASPIRKQFTKISKANTFVESEDEISPQPFKIDLDNDEIQEESLEEDLKAKNPLSQDQYDQIFSDSKLKDDHPDALKLWQKLEPFEPGEFSKQPESEHLESYKNTQIQTQVDPEKKIHSLGQFKKEGGEDVQHGFQIDIDRASGQIIEGYYHDGQKHGPWRIIDKKSNYWYNHYVKGKKTGIQTFFFDNGDKQITEFYEGQKLNEEYIFFESGKKEKTIFANADEVKNKPVWKLIGDKLYDQSKIGKEELPLPAGLDHENYATILDKIEPVKPDSHDLWLKLGPYITNPELSQEELDHYRDSKIEESASSNPLVIGQTNKENKKHGFNLIANLDSGLITEGYYRDGKEHGPLRKIDAKGNYWFSNYEQGQLNGKEHYVFQGGDIIETTYEQGKEVHEIYYFKSGTVKESKYENETWTETKQSYWELTEQGYRKIQ